MLQTGRFGKDITILVLVPLISLFDNLAYCAVLMNK